MSTASTITTHDQSRPGRRAGHEVLALALSLGVGAAGLGLEALSTVVMARTMTWLTPRPLPPWHLRLGALPAEPVLDKELVSKGRDVFQVSCSACHSGSGLGKSGLGKDLVHSDFVCDRSDAALTEFITKGRAVNDPLNTTKVAMPPKGGNDSLKEEDIRHVVMYLRGLQDPRRMPALPAWTAPVVVMSADDKQQALAAAGGDKELAEYILSGNKLFHQTCIACHGREGAGIKGNGKMLAKNDFIKSLKDDDLLAFIKQGRGPTDPKNTTGIQMPPKGGNPALSDDDLLDIISYLRTLQADRPSSASAQ